LLVDRIERRFQRHSRPELELNGDRTDALDVVHLLRSAGFLDIGDAGQADELPRGGADWHRRQVLRVPRAFLGSEDYEVDGPSLVPVVADIGPVDEGID